ncbi:MAG: anti-sigma factor family protein [Acidimicrobiia bacterium]
MTIMMKAMGPMLWVRRRLRPDAPARCPEVARVLQRYLDGEVDAHTLRLVSAHLEDCRRCGLEVETYTALKQALHRVGDPPAEPVERLRAFAARLAEGDVSEQS